MRIDVNICEFIAGPSPGFGARERNVNWAPHIDRGWNAAYGATAELRNEITTAWPMG